MVIKIKSKISIKSASLLEEKNKIEIKDINFDKDLDSKI